MVSRTEISRQLDGRNGMKQYKKTIVATQLWHNTKTDIPSAHTRSSIRQPKLESPHSEQTQTKADSSYLGMDTSVRWP
jgi:hypothetical protein